MKKNNIISDWLDQYGNPEIDKFVETQLNTNKMNKNERNELIAGVSTMLLIVAVLITVVATIFSNLLK